LRFARVLTYKECGNPIAEKNMRDHRLLKMSTLLLVAALTLSACGGAAGSENPTPETAPTAGATAIPSAVAVAATSAPTPTAISLPAATQPPTDAPTNTPEPPTPTLAPLDPNTMPITPPPTPTLAPLDPNTIPGNGDYDDELPFVTAVNDPGVGPDNGDGIVDVVFQFFGPDGQEVYSRTERNPQYCAFGGGDNGDDCDRWIFSEHGNRWPNDRPAQPGPHRLIVTIHDARGGVSQDTRNITLNLVQPEAQPLAAAISPADGVFGDELAFRVTANDPNVGGDDGAGIDNVAFRIVDSQGQQVYDHTERSARYCAFQGGENGQECNVWRFSEHGSQWPSGVPVENGGSYTLQVTVTAKSGQTVSQELAFTIQL
jgi:hypothetical protein